MADFLDHRLLRAAILEVLAGQDVRCAVAFWGDGARKHLFRTRAAAKRARIICDITMGGTNPRELQVELGAPSNGRLTHIPGLHAKLYLSDRGVVVCSANASNRGIGFRGPARSIEIGSFHPSGSKAFRDASTWFSELWEQSKPLDDGALKDAQSAWGDRRTRPPATSFLGRFAPGSLLARLVDASADRGGVGIVFSYGEADQADVEAAAEAVDHNIDDEKRAELANWSPNDFFNGWPDKDGRAWPTMFVCAHQGARGGISYWLYERTMAVSVADEGWSIFASHTTVFRDELGLKTSLRSMAVADGPLLAKIFNHISPSGDRRSDPGSYLCESKERLLELMAELPSQ